MARIARMSKAAIMISVGAALLVAAVTSLFLIFDALGVAERRLPNGTEIAWPWLQFAAFLLFCGIIATSWYKLLRALKTPVLRIAKALLDEQAAAALHLSKSQQLTTEKVRKQLDAAEKEVGRIVGPYKQQVFRELTDSSLDSNVQVAGNRNVEALRKAAGWLGSVSNELTADSIVREFKP